MSLLDQLKSLPRLQKLHLGWYFAEPWPDPAIVAEYARITGSVPLSVEWSSNSQIQQAVSICQAAPATAPITIGLTTQPYQTLAKNNRDPEYVGPDFSSDLNNFTQRLAKFVGLPVSHVFYDVEQWHYQTADAAQMSMRLDALHEAVMCLTPDVTEIWYTLDEIGPNGGDPSGWKESDYIPPMKGSTYGSCSLYYSEHALNQEIFRRSIANRPETMVPVIGFGGCYRRLGSSWGKYAAPSQPAANLWLAGLEINNADKSVAGNPQRFPLSQAPFAYFYHGVPNDQWLPDLIPYVMGSQNHALPQPAAA